MAGNPQIAVASLGLVPTIQGVRGNIATQLAGSSVMRQADTAGKSIGSRVAGTAMSALKTGLKVGGVVTAAVAGITLKGGLDRALGIEDAQAKMSGLGYATSDVEKIMGNALASVEGTAFGLDSAATTAAGAVAAGIKPGKELEGVLTTVANTAAATGGSMDEMGGIFNTVAAVGSAYTGEINMLAQRGVPMWQSLSDVLGVTQDEVRKMATKGEIDFETFAAAAELASGDVASAMGGTTRGMFMNMGAAFSRVGATIVTGFLPIVKSAMGGITEVADAVNARLGPIFEEFFGQFGSGAAAGVENFFSNIATWIATVDLAPVGEFFKNVRGWVSGLDFSGFMAFFDSLGDSMGGGGGGIGSSLAGIGTSLASIGSAAPELLASSLSLLNDVLGFMADHSDVIITLLPFLIAGFVAFRISTEATTTALLAQRAAYIATLPLRVTSNALLLVANGLELANTRAKARNTVATTSNAAATTTSTVAERARNIAMRMSNITTRIAAVTTRAFGVALRFAMGPIGLIIAGVTLLAAGLVYFFTKTETGQAIWSRVWGAIKTAASAVVDWFTGTALPILQSVWNGIAAGALWLYSNAILPAWNGIRTAISAVGTWITSTLWPALQTVWSAIGTAAMWLWQNVMMPAWTGIRIAIAVAVTAVMVYIDLLKWYFSNVIAPVALWLWHNVMQPVWNGIKSAISAVVAWFRDVAWPILQAVINWVANAAIWLWRNVFVPVWNGVKGAISAVVAWFRDVAWPIFNMVVTWLRIKFDQFRLGLARIWAFIKLNVIAPVISWFQNTVWPIINTVLGWIKMAFEGWKIILGAVWNFVRWSIINPVIVWFRDTAWPLINRILGYIKTGFNTMRDSLKNAWNFIRYNVVKPVIDWFSNTVKPKIDTFTDNLKTAFNSLKDSVLKAWDKIKSGMKAPINGVIGIYNEHIKGNFDKVAEKLFGEGKGPRLPGMSEFYTGGYTGPGAKYQEAGIVHADEFVIRKESQNDLARRAPGLLDALNRHGSKALGYAGGGLVNLRMPFSGSYPRGDGFGARGGSHKGIDWPMPSGAVLKAVAAGVANRTSNSAAGNKLELSIGNGLVAGYHHLSSFIAKQGQSVGRGTDVARVGSTGRSSGPHLHFSLKRDGTYVDPAPYLGAGGQAGSGGGGWWNPFDNLWGKIKDKVSNAVGGGFMGDMLTKVASNSVSSIGDWVTSKITAIGDFASEAVSGAAGRARWAPLMTQALTMKGQFGPNRLRWGLDRLMQESGGDPNAVNNWDSNARRGTPSKGLMQTIGPTFRAYAEPGYGSNILDPLSNILASINYTLATYGSLKAGWTRSGGYADGGLVKPHLYDQGGEIPPGVRIIANRTRRPEKVLPPAESEALTRLAESAGGAGATYQFGDIYGHTAEDVEREIEKKRKRREALYARA